MKCKALTQRGQRCRNTIGQKRRKYCQCHTTGCKTSHNNKDFLVQIGGVKLPSHMAGVEDQVVDAVKYLRGVIFIPDIDIGEAVTLLRGDRNLAVVLHLHEDNLMVTYRSDSGNITRNVIKVRPDHLMTFGFSTKSPYKNLSQLLLHNISKKLAPLPVGPRPLPQRPLSPRSRPLPRRFDLAASGQHRAPSYPEHLLRRPLPPREARGLPIPTGHPGLSMQALPGYGNIPGEPEPQQRGRKQRPQYIPVPEKKK